MNDLCSEKQAIEYLYQGNYTESISLYEQCIETNPDRVQNYLYLGLNYFLLGKEELAQNIWMSLVMAENPEDMEVEIAKLVSFLELEALRELEVNNVAKSKKIYEQILEVEPNYYSSSLDFQARIAQWNQNVISLAQSGQFKEAIKLLRLILQADETQANAWHDLGTIYYQIHEYDLAIEVMNKALELCPSSSLSHYNLGLIFEAISQIPQAMVAYQKAISLNNNLVDAYNNLGNIFFDLGRLEEAKSIYHQCLLANPNHFGTAFNLIRTTSLLNDTQEVNNLAKERARLFPDELLWRLLDKLALPLLYQNKEEIEFARQRFTQGLEDIASQLDLTTDEKKKQALLAVGYHNNFYLPYQNFNDLELQKKYGHIVRKVVQENYPQWCVEKNMSPLNTGEKIRIGYISAFLRDHSGAKWALGWIENTNRQEFEIYCYHIGSKIDLVTEEFRLSSDFFYHIHGNLETVCQQILKDNLHLLIYTDIGMESQSIPLAAMRLAPIQCNAWGHPVTSGLPTIDYYLSSELMEPENAQEHYSEKLVRLPNLGICYSKPRLPQKQKSRAEFGLREDAVIYISCQTLFKYLPQHDYIFPAIAKQVESAQFAFVEYKRLPIIESFRQRLKQAFAEFGLNSEDFCLFLPRVNWDDYLNRNVVSDIYLDTLGFSGGNTALQAIICNLPIVTCPGDFMRGRLAYSVVKMLGVEDTIAYNERGYIDIAVRLGNDTHWRQSIVEKIKANQDRVFQDKTCVVALQEFFHRVVKG
jgi:predicted O-linked N-acetylglucosamine transferase (SPINDLY family)